MDMQLAKDIGWKVSEIKKTEMDLLVLNLSKKDITEIIMKTSEGIEIPVALGVEHMVSGYIKLLEDYKDLLTVEIQAIGEATP